MHHARNPYAYSKNVDVAHNDVIDRSYRTLAGDVRGFAATAFPEQDNKGKIARRRHATVFSIEEVSDFGSVLLSVIPAAESSVEYRKTD